MPAHDKPLKFGLLLTGVLSLAAAIGLWQLGSVNAAGGPAPQGVPVDLYRVSLESAEQGDSYLGQINNIHSIQVRSQVPGRISRVLVTDGQSVRAGQLLFQLDAGPQAAQAAGMAAMANATRQEAPVVQKAIQGLQADRQAVLADLQFNQLQLSRFQQLATTDTVARKDVEQYQTAVTGLQQRLKALDANIAGQTARLSQIRSGVTRDLANARAAQATVAFYSVRAPYAGYIGQVSAKVGDVADPSIPLTTLTRDGAMQVESAVPVQAARQVRPGNVLRVYTPQGDALATATVRFIAPKVDPASQTLLIKADVANPDGLLKADEKVRIQLVTGTQRRLTVPVEAVFRQIGQPFVYRVVEGKGGGLTARLTPVKPDGYLGTSKVIIASGLQPDEVIVARGIQKLQDGVPVMDAAKLPKSPPTQNQH